MKNILLYIWQLPQNILGVLILIIGIFTKKILIKQKIKHPKNLYTTIYPSKWYFGISLGHYVFVHYQSNQNTINHEIGHTFQSKILGPMYLIVIGIFSFSGAAIDKYFHKNWTRNQRKNWYYNLAWEKDADKKGGVNRDF